MNRNPPHARKNRNTASRPACIAGSLSTDGGSSGSPPARSLRIWVTASTAPVTSASAGTTRHHSRGDRADEPERQVHQEDRAPPEPGDERRAEHLPGDGGDPDADAEHPEGALPVSAREECLDGREHLRHHHRRGETLRQPREHQQHRGGRGPACGRGQGERRHAADEQPLAPPRVAEPTERDEATGVRRRIAGDEQFQRGRAGVEVAVDRGQCHVDDEEVEHGEHVAEQDDR